MICVQLLLGTLSSNSHDMNVRLLDVLEVVVLMQFDASVLTALVKMPVFLCFHFGLFAISIIL